MAKREYLWANAHEWYEEHGNDDTFLEWLFASGHIDSDMIQDCFQPEMVKTGYFIGWPTDPDFPLKQCNRDQSPGEGICKGCGDVQLDEEERERVETGELPKDFECARDEEDEPCEECPIRLWIESGKRV